MQQSRHHGAVAVIALRVISGQMNLTGGCQRRATGRDGDCGCSVFASYIRSIHKVPRATGVGNNDHAITGSQQRGTHDLHMPVAGGQTGHTQTKELVLRIQRHDAGIASAIKLDALAGLPGGSNGLGRLLNGSRAGGIAVLQKCSDGVIHHLDHHIAGFVVTIHTAVDKRHTFADAAGQLELEIRQTVIPHAAAKAHHRGLAHMGTGCQFTHRQMRKYTRIRQHQTGHALLCGRQGWERGGDAIKHRRDSLSRCH